MLLHGRKPMPCIDRTLPDTLYFSMAEGMVDRDRGGSEQEDTDSSDNYSLASTSVFLCPSIGSTTPNTTGLVVTQMSSSIDKLPAI